MASPGVRISRCKNLSAYTDSGPCAADTPDTAQSPADEQPSLPPPNELSYPQLPTHPTSTATLPTSASISPPQSITAPNTLDQSPAGGLASGGLTPGGLTPGGLTSGGLTAGGLTAGGLTTPNASAASRTIAPPAAVIRPPSMLASFTDAFRSTVTSFSSETASALTNLRGAAQGSQSQNGAPKGGKEAPVERSASSEGLGSVTYSAPPPEFAPKPFASQHRNHHHRALFNSLLFPALVEYFVYLDGRVLLTEVLTLSARRALNALPGICTIADCFSCHINRR